MANHWQSFYDIIYDTYANCKHLFDFFGFSPDFFSMQYESKKVWEFGSLEVGKYANIQA